MVEQFGECRQFISVEMDEHVSVEGGCERSEPDVDHEEALQVDQTDKIRLKGQARFPA